MIYDLLEGVECFVEYSQDRTSSGLGDGSYLPLGTRRRAALLFNNINTNKEVDNQKHSYILGMITTDKNKNRDNNNR